MLPRLAWGALVFAALVGAAVAQPAFQSQPGAPRPPEIVVDRETRTVTVKVSIEDPNGYLIPNLHREHFTVYEDGVPQNANVDIDHSPVSLSLLLEGGGRYQELNRILAIEVPYVAQPLDNSLTLRDTLTVFAYADAVRTLLDVDHPRERLDALLLKYSTQGFSEANLFDALADVLNRTKAVGGRKAVLLISSGLDTFSRTSFDQVRALAERSDTPVYCIGLAGLVRQSALGSGPLTRVDWKTANERLKTLARVSRGRAYFRDTSVEIPAIYDDLLEHLRVRYVITYSPTNTTAVNAPRAVRVALSGKGLPTGLRLDGTYTP